MSAEFLVETPPEAEVPLEQLERRWRDATERVWETIEASRTARQEWEAAHNAVARVKGWAEL